MIINQQKRPRTFLSPTKIADIYMLMVNGLKNREIEKLMNLREGRVGGLLKAMRHYYPEDTGDRKVKYKHLVTAAKIIKKRMEERREASALLYNISPTGVVEPQREIDSFEKLSRAEEIFKKAISDFIEEQVNAQVKEIKMENIKLKKDMEKAEEAFRIAKNSNWVDSLKNKFGKKEVVSG